MRRTVAMLALMALLMMALAVPAFAVGKTNPNSCGIGNAVSLDAQAAGGFGHYEEYFGSYNPGATNPGEHLQVYRTFSQAGCQGN